MIVFILACCMALPARAAGIVDAAFVKEAMARGAILWDVRAKQDFRKGHIPGAVSVGEASKELRDDNSEDFIPTREIEAMLGAAGIDPAREIVAYGWRGTTSPHFARWALEHFGAARTHVFHDGIEGWQEAGGQLSTEERKPVPVALSLEAKPWVAIGTRELIARKAQLQLIDARTPREFDGGDIRAIRGGHIPGAVNIPYERNWKDPETAAKLARRQVSDSNGMGLRTKEELRALYAGLDPEKETVVYCQSGVRAAQTASVLRELGFRSVRVYDSSWLGYAARLDAPVENEVFLNVGQMNQRLQALMRRVEELEKQLGETRAVSSPKTCPAGAASC
jgi:thiosulfate/3-mercaptopyruvate sulfurtransferase